MKSMNQDDNKPVTVAVLKKELQMTRAGFKEELQKTRAGFKEELQKEIRQATQQLMQWTMDNFVTRTEFQDSMVTINARFTGIENELTDIKATMSTKQDMQKLYDYMDAAMNEIEQSREERTFYSHQLLRLDDRSHDHEKRVSTLEQKSV